MKGDFRVKPCNHGRATFVVVGSINGKRQSRFFRTEDEARRHALEMNAGRDIAILEIMQSLKRIEADLRLLKERLPELSKNGATEQATPTPFALKYDDDDRLTVKELAAMLRVHPWSVYNWVYKGRLPCEHLGRALRFRVGDVRKVLASLTTGKV